MADLNAKKRAATRTKDFGLPEKARTTDQKKESGNYPMPDKAHARNAKARAAAGGEGVADLLDEAEEVARATGCEMSAISIEREREALAAAG